jgi:hypothetical protein
MKRIICVVVFLLSLTSVFAQGISSEIGRRLTWWANSKDSREALVYQILRDIYPNEAFGALVRRVDSFSVNLTDAGSVLIGIYNSLGPDYGYTSLRDHNACRSLSRMKCVYALCIWVGLCQCSGDWNNCP